MTTKRALLTSLALAAWLWLPTLAVLTTDHLHDGSDIVALLFFSLGLLAVPLVLVPLSLLIYVLLARSLPRDWSLTAAARKRLLAALLMVKMLALVAAAGTVDAEPGFPQRPGDVAVALAAP